MGKAELKLELDALLMQQALDAKLDLLRVAENALRKALPVEAAEERARRWAEENAEAIRAHHERVARHGVFGAAFRTW